jgi:hypothetical protein
VAFLSIWLIYSGAFGGYLLRTGEAIVEGNIATAVAVSGGLVGIFETIMAVPGIIDLITGSRLAPGDAGAVVAAGSGWLAFGLAYFWGAIRPRRPPSEPP